MNPKSLLLMGLIRNTSLLSDDYGRKDKQIESKLSMFFCEEYDKTTMAETEVTTVLLGGLKQLGMLVTAR